MFFFFCLLEWVIFTDCKDNYLPGVSSFSQCLEYGSDTMVNCVITLNYSVVEDSDISLTSTVIYNISSSTSFNEIFSLTLDIKKMNVIGTCAFEFLEVFKLFFN
jgi:hypothetical protein